MLFKHLLLIHVKVLLMKAKKFMNIGRKNSKSIFFFKKKNTVHTVVVIR